MKLENLKKNKKRNKIIISSIIGILLIIASIMLYKTYAFYEEKKSFNVLKGRIPYFSKEYKETLLHGTDPVLGSEMIPILINESNGSVTYADKNKEWYNYGNKKWANAIILITNPSKTYNVGDTISESDIESYFVWIPKYSYQIWDLGNYNSFTSLDDTKVHPIGIKFGTSNTIDSDTECVTPNKSGESGTCTIGKYMTHPAFTSFGDVKGLWVGKFEATSTKAGLWPNVTAADLQIKPNVEPTLGSMSHHFKNAYNYKRNLDSHLIKNTEWGAITYLTYSNYGKCKDTTCEEVYINNYFLNYIGNHYKTGWSGTSATASASSSAGYEYSNPNSTKASTTGNYTGIYDLNGGTFTYVMGVRGSLTATGLAGNNSIQVYSGFTKADESTYDSKYYDIYSTSITGCPSRILGDATCEMGPFTFYTSWFNDRSIFVDANSPWFMRGGDYSGSYGSGLTAFFNSVGATGDACSNRIVLAPIQ